LEGRRIGLHDRLRFEGHAIFRILLPRAKGENHVTHLARRENPLETELFADFELVVLGKKPNGKIATARLVLFANANDLNFDRYVLHFCILAFWFLGFATALRSPRLRFALPQTARFTPTSLRFTSHGSAVRADLAALLSWPPKSSDREKQARASLSRRRLPGT